MSRIAKTSRIRWMHAAALVALVMGGAAPCLAGSLTVTVKLRDDRPLSGAVITLQAQSPGLAPAPPVTAIMDQVNLAFVPDLLVIPVHSSVQFPNSDAISHQVYSFSSARQFQLPLYRGKPYQPVVFNQPGVVTLGCNIHDNMLAYILVTDASFFGRADARGEWSVPSLPPGSYRLRVWHPLLNEPQDIERTVQAGAEHDAIELRLTRDLRPAPLTGRPRSWEY